MSTSAMIHSRPVHTKCNKRPTPPLRYHPYEVEAEVRRIGVPSSVDWDPDVDRWINEGGAIRDRAAMSKGCAASLSPM
jgi:hypothetical protein